VAKSAGKVAAYEGGWGDGWRVEVAASAAVVIRRQREKRQFIQLLFFCIQGRICRRRDTCYKSGRMLATQMPATRQRAPCCQGLKIARRAYIQHLKWAPIIQEMSPPLPSLKSPAFALRAAFCCAPLVACSFVPYVLRALYIM
jgi:hypothetical protein